MSPRLLFFVASHFALPQKEGGPSASRGKTPDRGDGAWRRGCFLPAAFLSPPLRALCLRAALRRKKAAVGRRFEGAHRLGAAVKTTDGRGRGESGGSVQRVGQSAALHPAQQRGPDSQHAQQHPQHHQRAESAAKKDGRIFQQSLPAAVKISPDQHPQAHQPAGKTTDVGKKLES